MNLEFPTVVIPPNNIGEIKAIGGRTDEDGEVGEVREKPNGGAEA
jgi:hypothetical protein